MSGEKVVEVECVEEVVAEEKPATTSYVPYKSYFGASGYHGSYLGGYGHGLYGHGLGHGLGYSGLYGGHSYVPYTSTYVPKVCATPTVEVEEKVEEVVEEVAEVKPCEPEMSKEVAETLRRSKLLLESVKA